MDALALFDSAELYLEADSHSYKMASCSLFSRGCS